MRKLAFLTLGLSLFAVNGFSQTEGLPANPTPGKCYIRCVTPETYEASEKRIVSRPAYKKLEMVPAEYKTVEERVLVKPASKKLVAYPAEFKTLTETIQIEDPHNAVTIAPAKLVTASESIEIKEKAAIWQYQTIENCKSGDPNDCLVLRLTDTPAEYKTIPTQKIEKEAAYTATPIAGKTMTITKQELVRDARVEEVLVPAEYMTVTRRVLVKDESVREIQVPAEYASETIQILKDPGGVAVWEDIECSLVAPNLLPIIYEPGNARLTAASMQVLDDGLYKLMTDKPNIRVEIAVHTDSRSDARTNMALSQSRAESVANYLAAKGIQRSRLVARGYGETKLLNRCADGINCSEAEHQQNRRTEFKVLSN